MDNGLEIDRYSFWTYEWLEKDNFLNDFENALLFPIKILVYYGMTLQKAEPRI